jgi:hypothetical protein
MPQPAQQGHLQNNGIAPVPNEAFRIRVPIPRAQFDTVNPWVFVGRELATFLKEERAPK